MIAVFQLNVIKQYVCFDLYPSWTIKFIVSLTLTNHSLHIITIYDVTFSHNGAEKMDYLPGSGKSAFFSSQSYGNCCLTKNSALETTKIIG